MSVLDCENIHTLYSTLEEITSIKKDDFNSFFNNFDIYDFNDKNPIFKHPQDVFLHHLKETFKAKINHRSTCWFHITHSKIDNDFSKGLQPLGNVIETIWDDLYLLIVDMISKEKWEKTRKSIENEFNNNRHAISYRDRIADSSGWGPYGFLTKDLDCFDKNFLSWHYFEGPEIVVEICKFVNDFAGIDLLQFYKENNFPCVVKFEYDDINKGHLGWAMHYLYSLIKKDKLSRDDNICFTTRGRVIDKSKIRKVQFIKHNP